KRTVVVPSEILNVNPAACNPRNRRELPGQFPHTPDQKLVSPHSHRFLGGVSLGHTVFPDRCGAKALKFSALAAPEEILAQGLPEICLPSNSSQLNRRRPGPILPSSERLQATLAEPQF